MVKEGPIEVLLVEDDSGDVELTRESLKLSKLHVNLRHVCDGQECMDYLRNKGQYEDAKKPDLILLDLNMPKKDGRTVLQEMKSDEHLKKIPAVILTTSDADADINQTYELGANCYITKPVDFEQFQKVVNEIANFWFTVVKFPDVRD
jgi:CheY-like chemotaxis protein